jgi:hypothetical protein
LDRDDQDLLRHGGMPRLFDQDQRAGAHYSLAVREFPSVVTAISHIPEQAWTPIRYRNRPRSAC